MKGAILITALMSIVGIFWDGKSKPSLTSTAQAGVVLKQVKTEYYIKADAGRMIKIQEWRAEEGQYCTLATYKSDSTPELAMSLSCVH